MKRGLVVVLLSLVASCSNPTVESGAPSIVGGWSYNGRRTTTGTGVATYTGRLDVQQQHGAAFDGNFSATLRDVQGVDQLVTGFLSGSFIASDAVDFDVTIGQETLRHVGRLRNDSLAGSWMSSDGSQGTFTAVRDAR